jgi:hypothetical protein
VIADWSADGSIDRTYPQTCYQEALGHLPVDVQWYSTAQSDIRNAMIAAARRKPATAQKAAAITVRRPAASSRTRRRMSADGEAASAVRAQARLTATNDPTALPTPLLVVAATAACLLAFSGFGAVRRRRRLRAALKHAHDRRA